MRFLVPLALTAAVVLGAEPADADVAIPFVRSTLPNGMTVILHENHDVPTIAVDIAFHVGSRFETAGRTGFAHLFEHLMFMGTRRVPTKAFDSWMEGAGGQNNASTSEDRTAYFDLGPPSALDLVLWMEADRLRDVGPTMSIEKLNAQREVVRNERRQRSENQPYAKAELRLPELLYPEGHPYHHPVIGSHVDLEAATVDDVKAFFGKYYDPANASLVVAGDFDAARVKSRIDAWFGTIPSRGGPPDPGAPGFSDEKTTLASVVRETIPDDVELEKTMIVWQSPKQFARGDAELDLLAQALATGKASRLYKTLVYDQKLAQSVEAAQESAALGSRFVIEVLARPGASLDKIEALVDKEIATITKTPLADDELGRAKNLFETQFVTRLQSVRARAALLNVYQDALKDPGYTQKDLDRYRTATKEGVRDVAAKVLLPNACVILRVVPKKGGKSK